VSAWNECNNVYKRVCCEKIEKAHIKLSFVLTCEDVI